MTDEKHIIKKAVVELYIPSANNAMDLQHKALIYFKEKICPMIERMMMKHTSPFETIRIDKLELDIKNFNPSDPDEAVFRKLEQQVEEKLLKLISEERSPDFSGEILSAVKKVSKEKAEEELFLYLLKTGNLPWWAKTEQAVSLEKLAGKILEQPSAILKKELAAALTISAVRKRIAYQLPPALIEKIIALVTGGSPGLFSQLYTTLRIVKESAFVSATITQQLYEYALLFISVPGSSSSLSSLSASASASSFSLSAISPAALELRWFLAGFIKEKNDLLLAEKIYRQSTVNASEETSVIIKSALAGLNEHFYGNIKKIFSVTDQKEFFDQKENKKTNSKNNPEDPSAEANPAAKSFREKTKDKLARYKKQQQEQEQKQKQKQEQEQEQGQEQEQQDAVKKKKEINDFFSGDQSEKENFEEEQTGDYFIKNSGLIIISPYLPAFFKELDLCDGKMFVSEEAKERAVYLLQYLTTGSEENFEEHEMVLNKVLCGFEVSMPLTLQFVLSEKEKEESLGLLQAVADNWPALKGTSGEGMRDAFFMRDGILEQQSNGWDLKVEKTTIDILLDKLPWGISIIQMPWSNQMIFVS